MISTRRDFSRNVARFGIVGALELFCGLRKADAGDYCETRIEIRECTICNHQIVSCTPWVDPVWGGRGE